MQASTSPAAQRMRTYLAERLPLPATAESAAEAFADVHAHVHRRLADEGASFQRVNDEFRRDMAVQMLTRSQAPINSISAQLAFDSTASFHRTFRGWTGDTPGAFRGANASVR
jgi:AraC-like DNA-binding protein